MPAVTNITVGAAPGWTTVDCASQMPVRLFNASDEAMTIRFGGAGDTLVLAVSATLRVNPYMQVEAQCLSGSKVLQVLRGGVRLE